MNRLTASLALIFFAAAGAAHAQAQSAAGELLDRIVAVVNDGIVLQSELDERLLTTAAGLRQQGVQLPPRELLERQILEQLIIEQVQVQRAGRMGIQVPDSALNSALTNLAQRNGLTLSQLPDALASQGLSYARYREDIRKEMLLEELRRRDLESRVNVTQQEVDEYLARNDANANVEFNISHILVPIPPGSEQADVDEARRKIESVYEKLRSGEDFSRMAVAYSSGQQALDGGRLGWRQGDQLPTLFADVVPDLAAGEFSAPIRSASGFHIVRVNETRGAEAVIVTERHARHILVSVNELVTDDDARLKLAELRERIVNGEEFGALAKEHSDDPGSANANGDLGWTVRGTFVPEFERVLAELEPGEMSQPFKSLFGWHLVELLGTRTADRSEEASINEAARIIRERKLQDEAEAWILQMRDEAFVDYRL